MRFKLLSFLTFGLATLSATPALAYNCTTASYYGQNDGFHGGSVLWSL